MDELQTRGDEDFEIFVPHGTVWNRILEQCPEGEIDEVKRLLGTSLVEQVIDLHEEVSRILISCFCYLWLSWTFLVSE